MKNIYIWMYKYMKMESLTLKRIRIPNRTKHRHHRHHHPKTHSSTRSIPQSSRRVHKAAQKPRPGQIPHRSIRPASTLPQPNIGHCRFEINLPHQRYLTHLLLLVILINTYSVYPNKKFLISSRRERFQR